MNKKRKNSFLIILFRDIRIGCKKNVPMYIFALLFSLISIYSFYKLTNRYFQRGDLDVMPGVLDCMVYLFGGMKILHNNANLEIPILWLTVQILVSISVCIYPVNDFYGDGSIILLQFGSRVKWWLSKCIWSILQVFILYLLLFVGIIVCVGYYGGGWQYHTQIAAAISGVTIMDIKLLENIVIIAPVIYSIMAVAVQISLSLLIGPVNSFVCIFAYHVLSIYCSLPVFLGNYSMIYRIKELTGQGVNCLPGVVICICTAFIVILVGILFFRSSDIIGKKS